MVLRKARRRAQKGKAKEVKYAKRRRHEMRAVAARDMEEEKRVLWAARALVAFLVDSKSDVAALYVYADKKEWDTMPFTICRAQASRDGRGWDGKGRRLTGSGEDKQGVVLVDFVTERDSRSGYPTNWRTYEVDALKPSEAILVSG